MDTPLTARTFSELIDHHATRRPDHIATHFNGRQLSYSGLQQQRDSVATALQGTGIGPGDRVGILAKNSDRYIELLLGVTHVGAVVVGLNWRLSAKELSYISNDSDMRCLFIDSGFADVAEQLIDSSPSLTQVVVIDGSTPNWPNLDGWLGDTPPGNSATTPATADSPALQLYTSGTTGNPKGVVLPHRAFFDPWVYDEVANMAWNRIAPEDKVLLAMPFFHVGGIGLAFMALRAGACSVIVPEFSPAAFIDLVPAHKITRTFLVPAALRAVLLDSRAANADWSSLSHVIYGAAPMPEALLLEALTLLKCKFVQNYGMTELCGTVVHLPPEDHQPGSPRLRAAGLPTPTTELRIIDQTGNDVATGEVGEIIIRSPATMLEYWRNPAATAETLIDGFIHTGDAGYLDEDGYLYIFDRMKDMIISGGENIYPIEVENAVFNHPAVSDAAVIGIPDDHWGEMVTAVVVLKEGSAVTEAELISHTKDQIASYKSPKRVIFTDELPRNASGKILKRELRQPFWAGRERSI